MLPLYASRIEDLGLGDFVKVDCAACHHIAPADAEDPAEGWAGSRGGGAGSESEASVPQVRKEWASGRFDQVARAERTDGSSRLYKEVRATRPHPFLSKVSGLQVLRSSMPARRCTAC